MKRNLSRPAYLLALFLLLLMVTLPGLAQFAQRGAVSGTAFDPSGAVIAGVQITLTTVGQSASRQLTTDKTGHFEFDNLAAGQYQLTAVAQGFDTEASQPVTVNIGEQTHFDFRLKTGHVTETATVTSEAEGMQTDQAGTTTNISERELEALPLNGLNFTSLAALSPGVSTYPQANINPGGTFSVGAQFAMGGVAFNSGGVFEGSRDNGFYVNGVNIDDNYESSISFQPASEALGTGKVQVSDFSAAVGNDISSISMQTKAGTNKFHGEAYDFMENTDFNATNPYNHLVQVVTGQSFVKPTIIRNQFGGNVGGPVYIPKVLPWLKNRVFFFANYERLIEHDGNQLIETSVPSAAERTGDFSELLGDNPNPTQLYNPFDTTFDENGVSSRPAIANNRLDLATRPDGSPVIDPNALNIINALYPLPNVQGAPSNETNFIAYQRPGIDNYTIDTRFDVRFTQNDLMFVTWSRSNGTQSLSGGLTPNNLYNDPVQNQAYLVTTNYVHVFSPHLTNEFIFGTGDGALLTIPSSLLAWYNSTANPFNTLFSNTGTGITHGVLQLQPLGYAYPGIGEMFRAENQSWQYSDNLDWVHGRHTVTAGFNYFRKSELDWDVQRNAYFGGYSASGGDQGYVGGDGAADLLMGVPNNLWVRYDVQGGSPTAPDYNVIFPNWGFYANDRFRITPKFTVSLGLRYDLSIPWYAPHPSDGPCCGIYTPTADGGVMEWPGIAPGLSSHYLHAPKLDFAPRVSVTYSPTAKTAFRAAYGIFYDTGSSQVSQNVGNAFYGTAATVNYNVNNTTLGQPADLPYLTLGDVFPPSQPTQLGSFPVPTGTGQGYVGDDQWTTMVYYDQKSMPLPYLQRTMADVQHQFGAYDVFDLSYVGAQGRKGWNEVNINLPAYQTGWIPTNDVPPLYDQARPNNIGRFGDVYVLRPQLNSFYNALIAEWKHNFSHGFQFDSNYTWGKTVSDYPWVNTLGENGSTGYGGSGFQYRNIYDRGEANFSHPNRFVVSGIWSPVYGKKWARPVQALATGWRLSGILTMESGDSDTVSNGGPSNICDTDTSLAQCPVVDAEGDRTGTSAYDNAGFDELNVSGSPNIGHSQKTPMHQFNTAAFSIPANSVRGNSGLGTVRGPGQNNLDLSLAKTFPIHKSLHLEFRGDAFNALNHTQWTGINTIFPSGDSQFPFGMVNGAREARIGQVAAKLVF